MKDLYGKESPFAQMIWVVQGKFRMAVLYAKYGAAAEDPRNRTRRFDKLGRTADGPNATVKPFRDFVIESESSFENVVRAYEGD